MTEYTPGGTLRTVYSPASLVSPLNFTPFSSSVRVMVAPRITAPVESVTRPATWPVVACPNEGKQERQSKRKPSSVPATGTLNCKLDFTITDTPTFEHAGENTAPQKRRKDAHASGSKETIPLCD